ncbi:ABC transporter permease [Roseateles sp. DAIF2]|uniref:MlaE family ABC transporter permease n=1 Tax=Roseateles sp. DAIF2 TaxID=2714952 RepID=UPI00201E379A|nr:ABC transporter permease [Roseateles sp. DAIF2]
MSLSSTPPGDASATTPSWIARLRRSQRLLRIGNRVSAWWEDARLTWQFVGEVLQALGRLLSGRALMRRSDLVWQFDQAGPRSVLIVSVVSGLVGVILAYMGAVQLERFGAQTFIADLVAISVVREVAALMAGIILAGRIGAAYAAQLGSMQANEEIDALRAMGVDPVEHLVLPRLLALLLAAPFLTLYAALVALLAGALVAVSIFGVTPAEFMHRSYEALSLNHALIGLAKGTVYCLLVALAGCRQGLHAGRSAQAVGQAVTTAVVQAIVWIVVTASAMTVAFQRLGW